MPQPASQVQPSCPYKQFLSKSNLSHQNSNFELRTIKGSAIWGNGKCNITFWKNLLLHRRPFIHKDKWIQYDARFLGLKKLV